jgi:Ca2+-binding EF-hand superfamily protein
MSKDISVNSIASDIMSLYDRNKNGSIEYRGNRSEGTRAESASSYDGENLNFSSTRYSREKLFIASDSNNDGKVTREELVNTIKEFDKNGDSNLTQTGFVDWVKSKFGGEKKENELSPFDRQYGEQRHTNSVSIPVNPKPSYPDPYYPSNPSKPSSVTQDPFSNNKPSNNKPGSVTSDPFSNNKPSNGNNSVTQDPFSNNKPSNNKPVTNDPFSSKPSNGSSNKPINSDPFSSKPSSGSGNKPVNSDPFSSGGNKPVSSDPFSSKPSSGSGNKPVSADPFKR